MKNVHLDTSLDCGCTEFSRVEVGMARKYGVTHKQADRMFCEAMRPDSLRTRYHLFVDKHPVLRYVVNNLKRGRR